MIVHIEIPMSLYRRLVKIALRREMTISEFIRTLVRKDLNND